MRFSRACEIKNLRLMLLLNATSVELFQKGPEGIKIYYAFRKFYSWIQFNYENLT